MAVEVGAEGLGRYLPGGATWGLGAELARLPVKRSPLGSVPGAPYERVTPMQIAARAVAGEVKARDLWVEYCKAMHGQRQLYWSPDLKDQFVEEAVLLDPPPAYPARTGPSTWYALPG